MLRELSADLGPLSPGATRLHELTTDALDEVRDELDKRVSRIATPGLPDDVREELLVAAMSDVEREIELISTTLMPILEGSASHKVPVELEEVLQRGVKKSARPRFSIEDVVLFGDHGKNYRINLVGVGTGGLRQWSKNLDRHRKRGATAKDTATRPADTDSREDTGEAAEAESRLVILAAPQLHRDSILLQSVVLGHELGHLRDWNHVVSTSIADEVESLTTDQLSDGDPDDGGSSGALQTQLETSEVAASWLSEFAADAFAVYAVGPPALFSIIELSGSGEGSTTDSETHPGADRRIAHMLELLHSLEYFNPAGTVSAEQPDSDEVGADRKDRARVELQSHLLALNEQYEGALDRSVHVRPTLTRSRPAVEASWEFCRSRLAQIREGVSAVMFDRYTIERWEKEVPYAVEALARGVPYGERREPDGILREASSRAILNAGWHVKHHRLDKLVSLLTPEDGDDDPHDARTRASQVLDGLVLKSFEVATYRHRAVSKGFRSPGDPA